MSMLPTSAITTGMRRTLPTGNWPIEGLEHVERCPNCGSQKRSALYAKLTDQIFFCAPGEWTLYHCKGCHAAYLDPRPTPETIGLAYEQYYTHAAPAVETPTLPQIPFARVRLALRNGYLNRQYGYNLTPEIKIGALLARFFPGIRARESRWIRHLPFRSPKPRLLDVGCGSGSFLARMKSLDWDVQGLDPDKHAISAAQEAELPAILGTIDSVNLPENYYDAVTLSHVIEHVHDPIATLQACYHVLRPGGTIWIGTPNLDAYGHGLFSRHWRGLEPPRHLVIFNPCSLRYALNCAGFSRISKPQPTWMAEWMFRSSEAIEQERDPYGQAQPLSLRRKRHVYFANLLGYIWPSAVEELVMFAQKPE